MTGETPGEAAGGSAAGSGGSMAMPGTASQADLVAPAKETGRDREVLFLQLMLRHPRCGVAMAQAFLDPA